MVPAQEEIPDKENAKNLKLEEIKSVRDMKFANFVNCLEPIDILQTGEKNIFLKVVRTFNVSQKGTARYLKGPLVISFYDDDFKVMKRLCILGAHLAADIKMANLK